MNGFIVHVPCPFCRGKLRICNLQSLEKNQPCKLKELMLYAEADEASKGEIKATFEVNADLMLQIARLQI